MNTSDLILSLRLDINDMAGNVTTDYALVNALNTVIRGAWQALGKNTITTKQISLTPVSGSVSLPDDYDSIVLVMGTNGELLPETLANDIGETTYKIIGSTLYVTGPVTLTYKTTAPTLTVSDTITPTTLPFPDSLFDVLKKYTLIILNAPQQAYSPDFEVMLLGDISSRMAMRNKTKLIRKPIFVV